MRKLLRTLIINVEIMLMILFVATYVFALVLNPFYLVFGIGFSVMAAIYSVQSPGKGDATPEEQYARLKASSIAFVIGVGVIFLTGGVLFAVEIPLSAAQTLMGLGGIMLMAFALTHGIITRNQPR